MGASLEQKLRSLCDNHGFYKIIDSLYQTLQNTYPNEKMNDEEEILQIHYYLDGIRDCCCELELKGKDVL